MHSVRNLGVYPLQVLFQLNPDVFLFQLLEWHLLNKIALQKPEVVYSVFNPQNPQKCMKNARILHGGSITECLTPCKFLEKSIKPVKNCGKVKNRVRSVEKVRNRLRMAAEAWEILQGNPMGKFYRSFSLKGFSR